MNRHCSVFCYTEYAHKEMEISSNGTIMMRVPGCFSRSCEESFPERPDFLEAVKNEEKSHHSPRTYVEKEREGCGKKSKTTQGKTDQNIHLLLPCLRSLRKKVPRPLHSHRVNCAKPYKGGSGWRDQNGHSRQLEMCVGPLGLSHGSSCGLGAHLLWVPVSRSGRH